MTDLDTSIKEYMAAQGGLLIAADIQQPGYSRGVLHVYSRAGLLERYSSGVYMRLGTLADDMVYLQRKFPAVFPRIARVII